ncbi:serine/arginine repetitive matrix protein 1-like [Pseudophryne corroboree]|uniref:serine/arginine repetitive matrix protein 1-like n=1 Tax=Pseudophryne corroboree TaxID=495146 RepID=UPI003081E719
MSKDKQTRSAPSPTPSDLSLHSNEEWEPTQEADTTGQACSDQPRSSRAHEKSKKKPSRKARSQPEEQSEEEASGEDAGPKKPRGPRYTEAENCTLVDCVDRSYDVLYGPRAQTTAARTKRSIWESIASQVTAISGNRRSTRNCLKRYSDCRRQTKKKMGIQRRHETATGGGPALNLKWLPWEDVIRRRMNPAMVEGVRGGVDSSRPAGFPEEEEPPRRRKKAGDKPSKRRSDDRPAQRTSPARRTSPAHGPSPVQQASAAARGPSPAPQASGARRSSPVRHSSSSRSLSPVHQTTSAHRLSPVRQTPSATTPQDGRQTSAPARRPSPDRRLSDSSGTVTEEPQDTTLVDPSPDLFESTGLTDETFLGFEDSRADVSSQTLEKSSETRTSGAPGAAASQDGEVVPRTSSGLASGIGSYFRPDLLLQESSEDDEVEVQEAPVTTSLPAQIQVVADIQEGQNPSTVQRVHTLASEIGTRQDTYTNVVGSRLDNIERTMEKMANSLLELQKTLSDSTATILQVRMQDHRESMTVLNILAESMTRLVDNTACLVASNQNMSESHRHSSSSQQVIATTLQMIYDKLPGTAYQHAGDPPYPPSQATRTPRTLPQVPSQYRQSQMYQGYTGMYPTPQMPPPPATQSSAAWAQRTSQHTPQPPRTSTPYQGEEEDPDRLPP